MNKVYTEEHREFVVARATKITDKELTESFNDTFNMNVSFAAMRKYRQRLGLNKSVQK
jgi:hypothetical protein